MRRDLFLAVDFFDDSIYNEQNINKFRHPPQEVMMKTCFKLCALGAIAAGYGALLMALPFSPATLLLSVPVCVLLSGLAHELGHLLAYRLLKLTWVRLSLSLWVLEKGKGLRLDGSRPLFSGSCTCAYDPSLPLRRYSLALLSGGITTLLLGAAALACAAVSGGSLASFLLCFGVVAVLGGIYNLLPFSADRKLLRQIKQESEHTA
jgi:hypothetical protein